MKTTILKTLSLTLVLGAACCLAAKLASAEDSTAAPSAPVAVADSSPAPVAVATPPAPDTSVAPAAPAVTLSASAGAVAKLAQAGLGSNVMLAYINNENRSFNLGSDQIVYLNDLGVSGDVVQAMLQRDASLLAAAQAAAANFATAATQPPVDPNAPDLTQTAMDTNSYFPPPDVAPDPTLVDDSTDQSTANDAGYFYNNLAPYGSWFYVAGAGLCWQPTVCLGNPEWQPYSDRGRWLDSDCGWYWQSDYSWGWAAFHYGRWLADAHRGWVWAPNRVWGPAWVSWRRSADYVGWAALPPSARFSKAHGFAHGSQDFGLRAQNYTFIPVSRLSDYSPARYSADSRQAGQIFSQSASINHFSVHNNRVVNQNIDAREVSAAAGVTVRHVQVREIPRDVQVSNPADRLTSSGNQLVVFRPHLPAPAAAETVRPVNPAVSVTSLRLANNPPLYANTRYTPVPAAASHPVFNTPLYYSGASSARPENYPAGSLVVIGQRNNSVAARASALAYSNPRNSHDSAPEHNPYQVYNAAAPVGAPVNPGESPYVIQARYHAAERVAQYQTSPRAESSRVENNPAVRQEVTRTQVEHQNFQPAEHFNRSEPRAESHVETHSESRNESHAASAPAPSVSHSSSGSSGSSYSPGSGFSGHR